MRRTLVYLILPEGPLNKERLQAMGKTLDDLNPDLVGKIQSIGTRRNGRDQWATFQFVSNWPGAHESDNVEDMLFVATHKALEIRWEEDSAKDQDDKAMTFYRDVMRGSDGAVVLVVHSLEWVRGMLYTFVKEQKFPFNPPPFALVYVEFEPSQNSVGVCIDTVAIQTNMGATPEIVYQRNRGN